MKMHRRTVGFVVVGMILFDSGVLLMIKLNKLQNRALRGSKSDNLSRASHTALIVVLAFTICYLPRYLYQVTNNQVLGVLPFYHAQI